MRYSEINLLGVLISPLAPMLLAAWLVLAALRRLALRLRWHGHVWHPALFSLSIYVLLLSCIVLLAGA